MAYDAALKAYLDTRLVDLFVASAITFDLVWSSENAGLSRVGMLIKYFPTCRRC